MIKKIALWTVYVLIVGLLVFGAANRTSAKTDQVLLFGNQGEIADGRGRGSFGSGDDDKVGEFEAEDHDESPEDQDWVSLSGLIVFVGADVLEIQTGTSGILEIEGRSYRFVQELGYLPVEGNEVVVRGFYENGEFEVGVIQDLTDNLTFQLRDEYGRPMWGGGRN